MSFQQLATLCSIFILALSQEARTIQNPTSGGWPWTPQSSQNAIRHETSPNCACTASQCICSKTITIHPSIMQRKVYLRIDYNKAGNPLFHVQLDGTKGTIIRGDVSAPSFKICRQVSTLQACVQLNDVTVSHSISGCVHLIIQVGTSSSNHYDLGCFNMKGSNSHMPSQSHIKFGGGPQARQPSGPAFDPSSVGTGHSPFFSSTAWSGSNNPQMRPNRQYANGIWNCPLIMPSCDVIMCSPAQPCRYGQVCLYDTCNRMHVCASVQRKCLKTTQAATTYAPTTTAATTIGTAEATEPIEIEPTEAPEPTEAAPV